MKRKAKIIIVSAAVLLALCSFGACNDTTKDDDIIYKDDNVTVIRCVPLEEPNVVYNLWDLPTEDEIYDRYEVIADVTIKSLEEAAISYEFMGSECTSYETLAAVSTNKIYYSADEDIAQEFIVAIPNTSYSCCEDFPEIAVNKRCIFFISSTEGLEDSLELYNYADYYLGGPANIINIDGSKCTANNLFSDYSGSSLESLLTDRCSMPLNDFENTLTAKINEKIWSGQK